MCVSCRYTGHKMKGYKLDCCLSSKDTHVLSCSEDGHVYCWDLVEVNVSVYLMSSSCLKVILWSFNICVFCRAPCPWSFQWGKLLSSHCPSTLQRLFSSQPWRDMSRSGGQSQRRRRGRWARRKKHQTPRVYIKYPFVLSKWFLKHNCLLLKPSFKLNYDFFDWLVEFLDVWDFSEYNEQSTVVRIC